MERMLSDTHPRTDTLDHPYGAQPSAPAQVAVGLATAGRPEQAQRAVERLLDLQPAPCAIYVSAPSAADFDELAARQLVGDAVALIVVRPASKGLTVQRNAILDALQSKPADFVVFFDDDFYPAADYLGQLARLFDEHPQSVAWTGRPAVDGISGPGVPHDQALAIVHSLDGSRAMPQTKPTYGTYGCNMAFRLQPVRAHRLRFDEALPLYAWLEDIEFSRRLAPHGDILESTQLRGVHMGIKSGRVSGVRFGYSQIANPLYCVRKGSMTVSYARRHMARNMAMNLARLAFPEPWVDRKGRLYGNLLAWWDVLRGRCHPMRVQEL
jgi:hypothetical protein